MASPASERVIIAETGDVFLTLYNPGAPFAVWEPNADHGEAVNRSIIKQEDRGDQSEAHEQGPPQKRRRTSKRLRHRAEDQDTVGNDAAGDTLVGDPSESEPSVVYRVSSQHLITASPKFKRELISGNGKHKADDHFYHIHTRNWSQEAFTILLNMLHLRLRQVPKWLSLELLAEIAMMVDYYQCWEAFELILDVWVTNLRKKEPPPKVYCRELMLWIHISWVLKLESTFSKTTRTALLQNSDSKIRDLGLSIPPAVLDALNSRRSKTIGDILATCHAWVDKFSGNYRCPVSEVTSFDCGSVLLGALLKQMKNMRIVAPRPTAPFSGFSIQGLYDRVARMKSPDWYHRSGLRHGCDLKEGVTQDVINIVTAVRGLTRDDFADDRGDVEVE